MVGAGTHPGAGVPGVLMSAKAWKRWSRHAQAEPSPDAAPTRRHAGSYDLHACRKLMRGGSKTFFAASLLLPARVRAPASALYAFCRAGRRRHRPGRTTRPPRWPTCARRLDAIYAGRPGPRGCRPRAGPCGAPPRHAARCCSTRCSKASCGTPSGRRYETLEDVHDYAARVAGTVGAMMALVMGARTPRALARACELGVAMQLTNIARDVGEDARNGRLYLPRALAARGRHRPRRLAARAASSTPPSPGVDRPPAAGGRRAVPPRRARRGRTAARLPQRHPGRAAGLCRDRPRSCSATGWIR